MAAAAEERAGWEVRPSGMVVQARDDVAAGPGGAPPRPPPPEIKVRVKYGGARHEVSVSPIATFGELLLLLPLAWSSLARSRLSSSLSLKPLPFSPEERSSNRVLSWSSMNNLLGFTVVVDACFLF